MIPFGLPAWIVLPWLFLLGATLGSFLNVCIHRIPPQPTLRRQLRAIWWPPSHCPGCGQRILVRDNLPVIGWLLLRGKCRFCRRPISFRYPLVETLNGLLFVAVYWVEVVAVPEWGPLAGGVAWNMPALIDEAGFSPMAFLNWRYLYHMALLEALVAATFIDLEHWIIPDATTLPAMAVGVAGGCLLGPVHFFPVWYQDPFLVESLRPILPAWLEAATGALAIDGRFPDWIAAHPHWHGLAAAVAGIVVGGGMVWGVRIVGAWALKKEAMGFGDVILLGTIGSFLGWQGAAIVFFLAPVMALAVVVLSLAVRRTRELPYGPYLSGGALLVIVAWSAIWRQTERIFSLGPLLPALALAMAGVLVACLVLIRALKRLLGIRDEEWPEEWTSADQLAYLAGENADDRQGCWRAESRWPGIAAARGTIDWERWRGE